MPLRVSQSETPSETSKAWVPARAKSALPCKNKAGSTTRTIRVPVRMGTFVVAHRFRYIGSACVHRARITRPAVAAGDDSGGRRFIAFGERRPFALHVRVFFRGPKALGKRLQLARIAQASRCPDGHGSHERRSMRELRHDQRTKLSVPGIADGDEKIAQEAVMADALDRAAGEMG